jgi:hypothetical protein
MKELVITPEDLQQIREDEGMTYDTGQLNEMLQETLDIVKQRKITTVKMLEVALGISSRSIHGRLEKLRRMGLIGKQYEMLKSEDGANHKTSLFYEIKKNERKRNSKKV